MVLKCVIFCYEIIPNFWREHYLILLRAGCYPYNGVHPIRNHGAKFVPDLPEVMSNTVLDLDSIPFRLNSLAIIG
jgi:hypothetical protein